ncbi:MAG: HAD hydrolase-like protein [Leptospiraceae bacterium]
MAGWHLLLFDLMDTVLVDPFFPAIRSFLDEDGIRHWAGLRRPGIFEAFEKGEISEREYFRSFYGDDPVPDHMPPVAKIKKRMFAEVKFRPGIDELLEQLSARDDLVLAIASNYSAWYHDVMKKRPELDRWFDYLFFSCEMGVRKPEDRYFEIIHESIKRMPQEGEPESIWFFDDRPTNLKPARSRGWKAHLIGIRSNDASDASAIQDEIIQPLKKGGIIKF